MTLPGTEGSVDAPSSEPRTRAVARAGGGWRVLVDAVITLALAVILFRNFFIEGYMISTGSMAPSLLGFHKRVACPECEYQFTHGIAFDDSGLPTVNGPHLKPGSGGRTALGRTALEKKRWKRLGIPPLFGDAGTLLAALIQPQPMFAQLDRASSPGSRSFDGIPSALETDDRLDSPTLPFGLPPRRGKEGAAPSTPGGGAGALTIPGVGATPAPPDLITPPVEKTLPNLAPPDSVRPVPIFEDEDAEDVGPDSFTREREFATCPNCGREGIDITHLPNTPGDQLLVLKSAFLRRQPRRWEVIVFRNPSQPTQAYVKRVVGLPNERIQIIDGDVFANGKLKRKSLSQQRAMAIPVFDHDFLPADSERWKDRWQPDPGVLQWRRAGHGFEVSPAQNPEMGTDGRHAVSSQFAWVSYRHWLRRGGRHTTEVILPGPLKDRELAAASLIPFCRLSADGKRVSCVGVLSQGALQTLTGTVKEEPLRVAVLELAEKSHLSPVTDNYGYNRHALSAVAVPVRDLMVRLRLTAHAGSGEFVVRMSDGDHLYDLVIGVPEGTARLLVDGAKEPVRSGSFSVERLRDGAELEMSLFDRQVSATLNGEPLWNAWPRSEKPYEFPAPLQPVRFGSRGLPLKVDHLTLLRDVHYTAKGTTDYTLGEDEYFALGDNSPVSSDSRAWDSPGVPGRLLHGKPFVVHLPSQPARWTIRGREFRFRIPDTQRIRYIR